MATSWRATVMMAAWVAPVVFGVAVSVTAPLPVPLALVNVSQGEPPSSAVQAHPVAAVTCTLADPPLTSTS